MKFKSCILICLFLGIQFQTSVAQNPVITVSPNAIIDPLSIEFISKTNPGSGEVLTILEVESNDSKKSPERIFEIYDENMAIKQKGNLTWPPNFEANYDYRVTDILNLPNGYLALLQYHDKKENAYVGYCRYNADMKLISEVVPIIINPTQYKKFFGGVRYWKEITFRVNVSENQSVIMFSMYALDATKNDKSSLHLYRYYNAGNGELSDESRYSVGPNYIPGTSAVNNNGQSVCFYTVKMDDKQIENRIVSFNAKGEIRQTLIPKLQRAYYSYSLMIDDEKTTFISAYYHLGNPKLKSQGVSGIFRYSFRNQDGTEIQDNDVSLQSILEPYYAKDLVGTVFENHAYKIADIKTVGESQWIFLRNDVSVDLSVGTSSGERYNYEEFALLLKIDKAGKLEYSKVVEVYTYSKNGSYTLQKPVLIQKESSVHLLIHDNRKNLNPEDKKLHQLKSEKDANMVLYSIDSSLNLTKTDLGKALDEEKLVYSTYRSLVYDSKGVLYFTKGKKARKSKETLVRLKL